MPLNLQYTLAWGNAATIVIYIKFILTRSYRADSHQGDSCADDSSSQIPRRGKCEPFSASSPMIPQECF